MPDHESDIVEGEVYPLRIRDLLIDLTGDVFANAARRSS
jgi:hypothetical protein